MNLRGALESLMSFSIHLPTFDINPLNALPRCFLRWLHIEPTKDKTSSLIGRVDQHPPSAENSSKNASFKSSSDIEAPPLLQQDPSSQIELESKIENGLKNTLSAFEITGSLGEGGYGKVQAAEHPKHGSVAIKLMSYDQVKDEASFQMTADRMSGEALGFYNDHPHIVPTVGVIAVDSEGNVDLYDDGDQIGELEDHVIIGVVSKLMPEAQNLEQIIHVDKEAYEKMDMPAKKQLLREVGEAMVWIHEGNMVYRDLKPGNIILQDGHAYLLDFGFQKVLNDTGRLTESCCGGPYHRAPEVYRSDQPTTHKSDAFSYGILLYEVVFGENPFDAKGLESKELQNAVVKFRPTEDYKPKNFDPDNPDHVEAWQLFRELTTPYTPSRSSIEEALTDSPFFHEVEQQENEPAPEIVDNIISKRFACSSVFQEREMQQTLVESLEGISVSEGISSGAYGKVFLSHHPQFGKVALKLIPYEVAKEHSYLRISKNRMGGEALAVLMKEHPHVAKSHGVIAVGPDQKIGLYNAEELEGLDDHVIIGVFSQYIEEAQELGQALPQMTMPQTKKALKQAGSALASLHTDHLVHRDIKPENILLSNGNAYLIDFGFLKRVEEGNSRTRTCCGCQYYVAPEVAIASEDATPKSDSFSFGILLYESVFKINPFQGMNEYEALQAIANLETIEQYCPKNFDPQNPDHIEAWDLIIQLTRKNAADRISVEEAMQHSFFRSV